MKWSEEFATGIESIDEQHKHLFQMTSDFRVSLASGEGERVYGLLLELLEKYTKAHFRLEEHCMIQRACPAINENKRAHQNLLEVLSEYQESYASHGYSELVAEKLVIFLEDWLENHICRVDLHLANCLMPKE